jgi:hypothetical protein
LDGAETATSGCGPRGRQTNFGAGINDLYIWNFSLIDLAVKRIC